MFRRKDFSWFRLATLVVAKSFLQRAASSCCCSSANGTALVVVMKLHVHSTNTARCETANFAWKAWEKRQVRSARAMLQMVHLGVEWFLLTKPCDSGCERICHSSPIDMFQLQLLCFTLLEIPTVTGKARWMLVHAASCRQQQTAVVILPLGCRTYFQHSPGMFLQFSHHVTSVMGCFCGWQQSSNDNGACTVRMQYLKFHFITLWELLTTALVVNTQLVLERNPLESFSSINVVPQIQVILHNALDVSC